MNASAHFERMQQRFEDAAEREHGRRGRRRTARRAVGTAVAAVAVAAVALVAVNLGDSPADASTIRVERAGDQVTVRLVGLVTDADRLADDLAEAGLPAEVQAVTTGPSKVGTIIGVAVAGARQDLLVASDPRSYTYTVAAGARATLRLGIDAPKGQPYDEPVDATAPGEPLHCRVAVGDDVGSARTAARVEGITLTWTSTEAGAAPGPIDVDRLDAAAAARLHVQSARRLADDRIEIAVAEATRNPAAGTGCG